MLSEQLASEYHNKGYSKAALQDSHFNTINLKGMSRCNMDYYYLNPLIKLPIAQLPPLPPLLHQWHLIRNLN